MKDVRVLLVHDQELLREGLRILLNSGDRLVVAALARDGHTAIPLIRKIKPGLLVVVVAMPELNGVLAARQIRDAFPHLHIVILVTLRLSDRACRALAAQSIGHVVKAATAEELFGALHAVHDGRPHPCITVHRARARTGSTPHAFGRGRPLAVLSAREREVLLHIVKGRSSKEIADRLGIVASTVDTYRSRIMGKFGIESLAELVALALKHGLDARE